MKALLRRLLWKFLRRDVLVLNPNLRFSPQLAGILSTPKKHILPVDYDFHLRQPWKIEYRIFGEGTGRLRCNLETNSASPLGLHEIHLRLPTVLKLEQRRQTWFANSSKTSMRAAPENASWLFANLEFRLDDGDGGVFSRRISHRLHRDAVGDAEYFTGAVYDDYEKAPGFSPAHVLDRLARHRPLHGKFLDIGCATGLLVAEALRRGLDAHGVDLSPWAIQKANARTAGRCRIINVESASRADFETVYDFVALHSVLEHVRGPEKLLRLVHDLTARGGLIFIQTLHAGSLGHAVWKKNWSGFSDPTHKSPWITAEWLATTARRLGFDIVASRTGGFWNDNTRDEVWRAFAECVQNPPAALLLEEGRGDFVEMILRKP